MSIIYKDKQTRILAYNMVYQSFYLGFMPKTAKYLIDRKKLLPANADMLDDILAKIDENISAINSLISQYLVGWKLDRVELLLKAVMQVSVAELLYADGRNFKIVINEAVEFLKQHSSTDSAKLANAVLNNIWHSADKNHSSTSTVDDSGGQLSQSI